MKKKIFIGVILCCFLFVNIIPINVISITTNMPPPRWANAEFKGTWGVSIDGEPANELGQAEGYLDTMGRMGAIEGILPVSQNDYKLYIKGIIVSSFMIGVIGIYNNSDSIRFYVGLGDIYEDGELYYNIYLLNFSTLYIKGTWSEINIK